MAGKFWFSANMPFSNDHKCWTQLHKTMKICQNVPHMYILKGKQCEKILVSFHSRVVKQKSGKSRKKFIVFVSSFWVLRENLSENEAKLLILQNISFLMILARKFWAFEQRSISNGHKFWTQLPKRPWNASKICIISTYQIKIQNCLTPPEYG